MRLTSWLVLLRNRLLGRSTPRARRVSRRLARVTEVLEQRTLLSAEYSLELVRRDSMEGAAIGSQEVGQFIVHKTATDGGSGMSMGIFLAVAESGAAIATPDSNFLSENDYYLSIVSSSNSTSPSTATAVRANNGQLGFWITGLSGPGGTTSVTVSVIARQDEISEGTENINVQLVTAFIASNNSGQIDYYQDTLGGTSALNLRIVESIPTVTVSASDDSATEPYTDHLVEPGVFTFTRSGGILSQPLTVNLAVSGTAENGTDYSQLPTTVTFPANATSVTLDVSPTLDTVDENDETAIVTLASGATYIIGTPSVATVTIHDAPLPDVTVRKISVSKFGGPAEEDDSEGGVATETFRISRSGGVGGDLTVNYSLTGTAETADYVALPVDSIVIPNGAEYVDLVVTPIWDKLMNEDDETVILSLTGASDPSVIIDTNNDVSEITIHDANYPVVWIEATEDDVDEVTESGDPGIARMVVRAQRAPLHCSHPVNVTYWISNTDRAGVFMAQNGLDYEELSNSITIPWDADSVEIEIEAIWDTIFEETETVELNLTATETGSGYVLGSEAGRIAAARIHDVSFSVVSLMVTAPNAMEEGPGGGAPVPAVLRFTRIGGDLSIPLDVTFTYLGTATIDEDFTGLTVPVSFPVGVSILEVTVTPVWDTDKEGPMVVSGQHSGFEDFKMQLVAGRGYKVDPDQTEQQFTIEDAPTPVVSVSAADAEASESTGSGAANFGVWMISRTGGTTQPLSVTVALSGDAQNGVDYSISQLTGTTVIIPAGASFINVQLDPIWNPELEPGLPENGGKELARLTIVDTARYDVGTSNQADILIADAPLSVVTIFAGGNASEDGGLNYTPQSATFTLSRNGSTDEALTVSLGANSGLNGATFASSSDYTFSPTISNGVTIPKGQSSVTITVTPVQDQLYNEGPETLKLTIQVRSPQIYVNGSPDGATITIADAVLPVVSVSVGTSLAYEETSSGSPGAGSFHLHRTGPLANALVVSFQTSSGTATLLTDYQLAVGSSSFGSAVGTFPSGQSDIEVMVNPVWDDKIEGDETVVFKIIETQYYTTLSPGSITPNDTATVVIVDQLPPSISISVQQNAKEEDAWTGDPVPGKFRISRVGSTSHSLTVYFDVGGAGNTATQYADYSGSILNGTAVIPAGSNFVDLLVNPKQDGVNNEPLEHVIATLQDNPKYVVMGVPADLTIEDQPLPSFSIMASDAAAAEPDAVIGNDTGYGEFTVMRTGGHKNESVSVTLELLNLGMTGTASVGIDYDSTPDLSSGAVSLTFAPGQMTKKITIKPKSDSDVEMGGESVILGVKPKPDQYLVSNSTPASVLIADGPPGPPTVMVFANPVEVSEVSQADLDAANQNHTNLPLYPYVNFLVRRVGKIDQPLSVYLDILGSATWMTDYTPEYGTSGVSFATNFVSLSFQPGTSEMLFRLRVVDDTLAENDETIVATIRAPSSETEYEIGLANKATVTIRDPDGRVKDATQSNALTPICGCQTKLWESEEGQTQDDVHVNNGDGQLSYTPWFDVIGEVAYDMVGYLPIYLSLANPHPIISVDIELPPTGTLPTTIDAVLKFGNAPTPPHPPNGATVAVPSDQGFYRSQRFIVPGDAVNGGKYRVSLLADATYLKSGQFDYEVQIINHYPTTSSGTLPDESTTILGSTQVFNEINSNLGNRWVIPALPEIKIGGAGITLLNGNASGGKYTMASATGSGGGMPGMPGGSTPALGAILETPAGSFSDMTVEYSSDLGMTVIALNTPGERRQLFDPTTGVMLKQIDRLGEATTYTYVDLDGDGIATDLKRVVRPDGKYINYTYAPIPNPMPGMPPLTPPKLIALTDFNGRTTEFEHDTSGHLTKITGPDPDGSGATIAPVLNFSYDASTHLLIGVNDPSGVNKSFGYGTNDRRFRSMTVDGQNVLSMVPAEVQALTQMIPLKDTGALVTNASGTSRYQVDNFGSTIKEVDPQGRITLFLRDSNSQVLSMMGSDPDDSGPQRAPITSYTYDGFGRMLSAIYPNGRFETWTYPSNLRGDHPLVHIDVNGRSELYTYDAFGNTTSHRDFDNLVTTYSDYSGRNAAKITLPRPGGDSSLGVIETQVDYSLISGQPTREIDLATGHFKLHSYDGNYGWLKSDTDELGRTTTYNRDIWGRLLSMTEPDPDGTGYLTAPVTVYHYDALGRLDAVTEPDGIVTQYQYNWLNQIKQVQTIYPSVSYVINGQTEQVFTQAGTTVTSTATYDGMGRLTETVELGNQTSYSYFSDGQISQIIHPDPDGIGPRPRPTESFTQDTFTRNITAHTDVLGHVTTFQYDIADQLISQTDYLGAVTTFTLDSAGNITKSVFDSLISSLNLTTLFQYDALGRITKITDSLNRETEYKYDNWGQAWYTQPAAPGNGSDPVSVPKNVYDSQGRLIKTFDAAGRTTLYEYNSAGDLAEVQAPDGTTTESTVDALGRTKTVTTSTGRVTTYVYNPKGQLVSVTDPDAIVTSYGYDIFGNVRQIQTVYPTVAGGTPPTPSTSTFTYDAWGRLLAESSPTGWATYEYDLVGNLLRQTDSQGQSLYYTYDVADRVTSIRRGQDDATTSFVYDDLNLKIFTTDPTGQTFVTWTDELGRTIRIDRPDGSFSRISYTTDNEKIVEDERGNQTTFQYDNLDRLVKITDALNGETTLTYDADGNVASMTDANGNQITATYDLKGRMLTRGDGSNVEEWEFDDTQRTVTYTDTFGRISVSKSDAAGRLTSFTAPDPDGPGSLAPPETTYQYDSAGRMNRVTGPDPDGAGPLAAAVTQYKFNALGQTSEIINAKGDSEFFYYNAAGRVSSVTDFDGNTTSFTYDTRNDQINTVTDPLGRITTYNYDTLGRLTQVRDPLNHETISNYDPVTGRLNSTKNAANGWTYFTYDEVGNLKTLKDPDNNVTTWSYDELNRPVSEATADGTRTYTYDAVGNLKSATNRLGEKRTFDYQFVYDGQPNYAVTHEKWLNGNQQVVRDIAYAYNSDGQLTSVADPIAASEYHYTYDAMGRLATSSNSGTSGVPTTVLTYGYEPQNRKRTVSANVNGVNDFLNIYTYDVLGRVTQITQQAPNTGANIAPKRVDFTYTKTGRFATIQRFDDLNAALPVADSAYNYNAAGDLLSLSYTRATGPNHSNPVSVTGYSWNYDAAGRITQFASPDEVSSYSYDATNQLTSANHTVQTDETYTYDANGNRTMSGYVTSGNNRLMSDGTYTYQYDAEGHRTRQTELATGAFVSYDWDHRSRLTDLTFVNGSGQVTKQVRYTYDAFDRRIRKEVDGNGNGTYETSESYVYDGSNIVLVADETGSLTNRYLHGPAVDQILADEQISANSQTPNEVLWALTDNQGSVRDFVTRAATTGQTQIVDHLVYDAYGQITAHTNPQHGGIASTKDIHYAYTGREWDADANLYFYRARWYDAHAGRFISEDPLGFGAGDTNVQRYVGNSSPNRVDPSGLRDGHHWMPQSVFDALGNLLDEKAIDVFKKGVTDPVLYDHGFDTWTDLIDPSATPEFKITHAQYNTAAKTLLQGYYDDVLMASGKLKAADADALLKLLRGGDIGNLPASFVAKYADQLKIVAGWRNGFFNSVSMAYKFLMKAEELGVDLDKGKLKTMVRIWTKTGKTVNDLGNDACGKIAKQVYEETYKEWMKIPVADRPGLMTKWRKFVVGYLIWQTVMAADRGYAGTGNIGKEGLAGTGWGKSGGITGAGLQMYDEYARGITLWDLHESYTFPAIMAGYDAIGATIAGPADNVLRRGRRNGVDVQWDEAGSLAVPTGTKSYGTGEVPSDDLAPVPEPRSWSEYWWSWLGY